MSLFYTENEDIKGATVAITSISAFIVLIIFLVVGMQWFKVFAAEQSGKAELAQAEWNRQIIVRQAQARKDAASLEAEAEIIRAGGVSKANEIVAQGLGGPEGYLRYLYIQMLSEQKNNQVIYIPTEAGLPILEAGKR